MSESPWKSRGSSPLARGLPATGDRVRLVRRIIPARAGFTHSFHIILNRDLDHPRSRGVYTAPTTSDQWDEGSSPLARGLPGAVGVAAVVNGIIPARAGFTRYGVGHKLSLNGSSPLARGLRACARKCAKSCRIIPARAGFTRRERPHEGRIGDHPRSRGVYRTATLCSECTAGSSPLARGLPILVPAPGRGHRIIPARAGFT